MQSFSFPLFSVSQCFCGEVALLVLRAGRSRERPRAHPITPQDRIQHSGVSSIFTRKIELR